MKLSINALAVAAICIGLSMELNAQEYWRDGYSPFCGVRGGCHRAHEGMGTHSIESNTYGRSLLQSNRPPFQPSYRDGGCGYGGTCNRNQYSSHREGFASNYIRPDGRCPYEQRQFGERLQSEHNATYDPRPNDDSRPAFGSTNGSARFDSGQPYSAPRQPGYSQSPADLRPELRTPNIAPRSGISANDSRRPNHFRSLPPAPTNMIPPPKLPPQPLSNSRPKLGVISSAPQLLPPTNSNGFQRQRADQNDTGLDHSGHDHSGHDHSGHNHEH